VVLDRGGSERLLVIVPARDEASVIDDLIADLADQELDGDSGADLRIVIVDDASTDGTAQAARAAILAHGLDGRATVIQRKRATTKAAALEAGTAAALTKAASHHADDGAATIVVLDADARLPRDALRQILAAAAGRPATARRRMLAAPAPASWLVRLGVRVQDDEQTVDHLLRRLRFALGSSGELRGDGMVITTGALRAVGGWPRDALCEDLEVSTSLTLGAGLRIRPLEIEIWEQPVIAPVELVRQRLRWADGAVRRDLRLVWPRVLDPTISRRRRLDAVAYAAQTLVGVVVAALSILGRPGRRVASLVITAYAAVGLALALVALAPDAREPASRSGVATSPSSDRFVRSPLWILALVGRAVAVVGFGALWPVMTAMAWLRVLLGRPPRARPTRKLPGFRAPWDQGLRRARAEPGRGATPARDVTASGQVG